MEKKVSLRRQHFGARFLAWFFGDVMHYRENVVYTNLARCFPEKSYGEITEIRDRFYSHFGKLFTEMLWFGRCRGEKGRRRLNRSHIVEITNPEVLNSMFAAAPQMMVLQTHAGNWELISGFRQYSYTEPVEILPEQIGVAYAPLYSKFWNRFMAWNRVAPICDTAFDGYVDTAHILRYVLENKDKKKAYVFITDQSPYRHKMPPGELTFMGRNTKTMTAAAGVAVKMNMSVVYLRYREREEGGYAMTFVPIAEHAGEMSPMDIMTKYYQLLEEDLREQPWNYLWTHKRWK